MLRTALSAILVAAGALAWAQADKPPTKQEPPKAEAPKPPVPKPPESPKTDLAATLSTDKTEYVLGEDVTAEVTLTNGADRDLEVAELVFEERALAFDVTFEPEGGKKQFLFAVTRPEPHLVGRLGPARVALRKGRSVAGLFRIPTLAPGALSVTAVYKGAEKEVRSAAVAVTVKPQETGSKLAAILETSQGTLQINLLPSEAPNNVANFVSLARRGYYDGLVFHRVVKNMLIQSGCPYDNGLGGPGYALRSEAKGQKTLHDQGTVSMSGYSKVDFTGSQFFVSLAKNAAFDGKYTVVGKLAEASLDVAKKIAAVEVDRNTDRPKEDVPLKKVTIAVVK
jgi:peptidyl-prolyl cis-trans isomerase B (cyclophilin B)